MLVLVLVFYVSSSLNFSLKVEIIIYIYIVIIYLYSLITQINQGLSPCQHCFPLPRGNHSEHLALTLLVLFYRYLFTFENKALKRWEEWECVCHHAHTELLLFLQCVLFPQDLIFAHAAPFWGHPSVLSVTRTSSSFKSHIKHHLLQEVFRKTP